LSTRYITTLANIHNAVNGFEEADTVMRDTAQSFYDAYRLENNLSNSIKAFKQFHQSLAAGMYPLSALQHAAVYACPAIEIVATAVDFVASLSLTIAMFAI
jgi:hypothetical protein